MIITKQIEINSSRKRIYLTLCTFLLLTTFLPLSLLAQTTHSLSGMVTDATTGNELIGCNVRLLNREGKQAAGSSTNVKGSFTLRQLSTGTYTLVVTYVGYKEYKSPISIPHNGTLQIKLNEDSNLLSTVVVEARAADMTVKGDTVVFNANAFHAGQGAMLEDLIKRLPGAQVDDSGNIVINGKTVSKIMVDGKEFFSGDTRVATKNLPAEVVDRLELLDRSSDASRMSGFDDGDEETVLNLSFKAEHKQGLFGNLFAGYGTNNRYEANAVLNNFSGENRVTAILGTNNTNNKGMNEFSSNGNQRPRRRGQGTQGVTTSTSAAVDIAQSLHKNLEVEANARYGYASKVVEGSNTIEFLHTDGANTLSAEQSYSKANSHSAEVNARFSYKPDTKTEVIFMPFFSWGKSNLWSREETNTLNSLQQAMTRSTTSSTTEGNNLQTEGILDLSRRLSDSGRVLSLHLRGNYTRGVEDGYYGTSFNSYSDSSLDEALNLLLNDRNSRYGITARVSYVEPLGAGYFLQGLLQWQNSRRDGLRDVFSLDTEGAYTITEDKYGSSFATTLNSYQAALNLQKRGSSYDVTVGLGVEPTRMNTWFLNETSKDILKSRFNLVPKMRINYRPNKQTSWRLDYRGASDMPDVRMMMPVIDPTDPLQITEGNSALEPSFTHKVRSFLRHYNPTTRVAVNLFMRGTYVLNDVASSVTYEEGTGRRIVDYRNVDGNASFMLFGMGSMPFITPLLTLNVGGGFHFNHQIGFVENTINAANTWMVNPMVNLSYAKGPLYLRLNGSVQYTGVVNSIGGDLRNAWMYQTGLDGSVDLPYNFKLESEANYRIRSGYGSGYDQNEWIWNASLSYSFLKNKVATVRLKAYDILGNETGISRAATALTITDSKTNVLGRYVMLHFIYRFSSFAKDSSQNDFQGFGPGFGGPGGRRPM